MSQRTVLEVILADSWRDIKRDCTAVLEAGGFKGLKIRLGNAVKQYKELQWERSDTGQIVSLLS